VIVDDSAYVRKVIKQMLSRSPFIEVVGTARDGEEALSMVKELQPDVVTLDLIMPGIGGLGFIREQMARAPVPIVIVSIASETSQDVLDALDAGALEFVQKPSALATERVFEMSEELIEKVKAAGSVEMAGKKLATVVEPVKTPRSTSVATRQGKAPGVDAVVIGISTGGPHTLRQLIPRLPADFPVPVVVVMHMPVGYTEMYSKRLNEISAVEVHEAYEGEILRPGQVLIAPAGRHLTVTRQGADILAHLDARPFDTLHRPSVDVLFRSASEAYDGRLLGVVMTGMGEDGKVGAADIRSKGGRIIAEAEETCIVYGMPRAVVQAGLADRVIPLDQMAEGMLEAVYG
jgi:two-component system chemotaxis response regulator CheB